MDDTVSAPVRNDEMGNPVASSNSNKIVEENYRQREETGNPTFNELLKFTREFGNFNSSTGIAMIYIKPNPSSAILENKDFYDLKRWEIGELASKIGQLYYQYYSRTSETNYLHESFVFYEAIRSRNYFKDVMEAKNAALVVKKLRYIARFAVVALLLNRADVFKILHDSLTTLVEEYNAAFKPSDYADWKVVLSEISTFIEADKKLSPIDPEGKLLVAPTRLKIASSLKFDKDGQPKLKLQEAILVANYQNQIKFAELTLDMYRIMQSLEREPPTLGLNRPPGATPADQTTSGFGMTGIENNGEEDRQQARRSNPRKYLLYRPSFAQIALYLATCFKDISENSAMLLYLSADGSKRNSASLEYSGGVATAINVNRKTTEKVDQDYNALVHTLHPQDLVPFTRKPFFLIVDSTNSAAFKDFNKVFNQPFACLLSPAEYPPSIKDITQIGSLFSLFLHCPIKAFAFISDITQISQGTWDNGILIMESLEKLVAELLETDTTLDKSYKRFIQDDFLCQFCTRFVITSVILSFHTAFNDPKHLPVANPAFPPSILQNADVVAKVQELVKSMAVTGLFSFN